MTDHDGKIAEIAGYSVQPSQGKWVCSNGGVETGTYDSEAEAWDAAEFEANGDVMGPNNVSSEDWDAMSPEERIEMAEATFASRKP